MTNGTLPLALARHCVQANLATPDLVAALEKCENMALKLKAAKFLRDTGKTNIEELRAYARELLKGDTDAQDEQTST